MARLNAYAMTNLDMQGFGELNPEEKSRNALPLRFTPSIGTALVLVGLIAQSPPWLAAMTLVALSGALLPNGMVIDLTYNYGVRHLLGAPRLPRTPAPRRFSYLLSAILLASSALAFSVGEPVLGLILGGLVVLGGAILISTLWCLGSWLYWKLRSFASAVRVR